MDKKRHPRNRKHGNPGGRQDYYTNQIARDTAHNRGREARKEINRMRDRIFTLGSLNKKAYEIVCASRILAGIDMVTPRLDVDGLCAYANELSERLFYLELNIVQHIDDVSYLNDERLSNLEYALDLRERAEGISSMLPAFIFYLDHTGIVLSIPGARCQFSLEIDGLRSCSAAMDVFRKILINSQRSPMITAV